MKSSGLHVWWLHVWRHLFEGCHVDGCMSEVLKRFHHVWRASCLEVFVFEVLHVWRASYLMASCLKASFRGLSRWWLHVWSLEKGFIMFEGLHFEGLHVWWFECLHVRWVPYLKVKVHCVHVWNDHWTSADELSTQVRGGRRKPYTHPSLTW